MWKKYKGQVIRAKKKKTPVKVRFFIFVFLILAGLFFIFYEEPQKIPSVKASPVLSDAIIQEKIKEHSQSLRLKSDIAKDQALFKSRSLENNMPLDDAVLDESFIAKDGVDLGSEKPFDEIISEMEKVYSDDYVDIEDRIASYQQIGEKLKLYKEEQTEDETEIFIQEFLKNAEEKGYLIKLNDNLDVVSVTKIK